MSDKPEAMTDLAQRIGTLFVLAMQTNDPDLRDAASVSPTELGFTDGPSFLPVARLLKEREELRKVLEAARYWIVKSGAAHPSAICNQIDATLLTLKSKD